MKTNLFIFRSKIVRLTLSIGLLLSVSKAWTQDSGQLQYLNQFHKTEQEIFQLNTSQENLNLESNGLDTSSDQNLPDLVTQLGRLNQQQKIVDYYKQNSQKLKDSSEKFQNFLKQQLNSPQWQNKAKDIDQQIQQTRDNGAWGAGNSFYLSVASRPILFDLAAALDPRFQDLYDGEDQITIDAPTPYKGLPFETTKTYSAMNLDIQFVRVHELKSWKLASAILKSFIAKISTIRQNQIRRLVEEFTPLDNKHFDSNINFAKETQTLQKLSQKIANFKEQIPVLESLGFVTLVQAELSNMEILYTRSNLNINPDSIYVPKTLHIQEAFYTPVANYVSVQQNIDGQNPFKIDLSNLALNVAEWNQLGLYSRAGLLLHEAIRRIEVIHRIKIGPQQLQELTAGLIATYLEGIKNPLSEQHALRTLSWLNGDLKTACHDFLTPQSQFAQNFAETENKIAQSTSEIKLNYPLAPYLFEILVNESRNNWDQEVEFEYLAQSQMTPKRRIFYLAP